MIPELGGTVDENDVKALFDTLPDAIIFVDTAGKIAYSNDQVEELFGYKPDEIVGDPVEVLVPEDIRTDHVALRNEYLENPGNRPMGAGLDLHARRKDGSTFPVDISLKPAVSDNERYIVAAIRDKTEHEQVREKYRTLLETAPDAIFIADIDTGEIQETNEQGADLLGYDRDEIVGMNQTDLHPSGEEDRYQELFEHHISEGQAVFSQHPDGSDIYVETKEGEHVPVEINARVIENGGRQLITGVFRDITERKQRESQLKSLHRATRQFIAASSQEEVGQIIADTAKTVLGYEKNVVRLAAGSKQLRPTAVTEEAKSGMGERPEYSINGETPAAAAYNREEPVLYDDLHEIEDGFDRGNASSAMYLPIGSYGVLSIVDSETEAFAEADIELASILVANAKQALARIENERELRLQNEQLDEFASVVSHDLRNPLNVAQGRLRFIKEEHESEHVDAAVEALDRMEEIIEDTLTLARKGRSVGEKTFIRIDEFVDQCWEMVDTAEAQLAPVDGFRVRADRDRLRHVFENLFRNAVDHGGETVTVRVGRIDDDGFYVEDNGSGIPDEEREHVLEPGYSLTHEGTGLGLTIVNRIAEAHGWELTLTEGDEGGARFEFTQVDLSESNGG